MKNKHVVIAGLLSFGSLALQFKGEITAASVFLVGAALAYLIGDKNEH